MKRFYLIPTLLLALAFSMQSYAGHLGEKLMFSARLNGAQEVPSIDVPGMGVASFVLNGDMDSLCVQVNVSGLSGAITGMHIHDGVAGMNGDVLVNFSAFVDGNMMQTVVSPVDPALITKMIDQELYLNVHTAANPSGEIRGQIKLETDWGYQAQLSAEQETMEVMSDATGLASFNLSLDNYKLEARVAIDGLTGPITGAHLHQAMPGMDGDVVINLTDLIEGNTIEGVIIEGLNADFIDALKNGEIYINIHTDEYPAGEIRGQLSLQTGLVFDSWLNTDQEVTPPMGSEAAGLATLHLNSNLDTLYYSVQASGLSGAVDAAHIHMGAPGEDGAVIVGLMTDGTSMFSGTIAGENLSIDLIHALLNGGSYINVHTEMNPAGEIRGQVYRLAREGYRYFLGGDQEVPAVSTMAMGGGMVSMDRDQSSVHFMMVVSDLSGPLQMAHFHNASAGMNGDVEFDLSDFFNGTEDFDAAFGYWNAESEQAFESENALQFRDEAIYVNIHTMMNMSGEVRGQVLRGGACEQMIVGVEESSKDLSFSIYPNPFSSQFTIDLDGKDVRPGDVIVIRDLSGRAVESFTPRPIRNVIDLSGEPSGIYLVEIRTVMHSGVRKIIKE